MNLAGIQATVAGWAVAQSGLPVYWVGAPQPMQLKPRIELDGPLAIEQRGTDWILWSEPADASGSGVVPTAVGNRELTIIIRAIGRSASPNDRAQYWIERLRTSLHMPSVLAHFHSGGLAIVRSGPIAQYDAPIDNRIESIAAAEIRFATTVADADAVLDTIAAVQLSSHIQDESGTELPVPPNVNVTIGPIGG